jgi:hypothetical protein
MTAKECLEKNEYLVRVQTDTSLMEDARIKAMIEHTKYHVQKALESAYNNCEIESLVELNGDRYNIVNKDSIMNSYPIQNIK